MDSCSCSMTGHDHDGHICEMLGERCMEHKMCSCCCPDPEGCYGLAPARWEYEVPRKPKRGSEMRSGTYAEARAAREALAATIGQGWAKRRKAVLAAVTALAAHRAMGL